VVGHEYVVFAIDAEATPPRGILPVNLLLLNELREPEWHFAAMFSVTSDVLPSTWRAKLSPTGELELAPAAWLQEGFWGALHGGGPPSKRAREIFDREVALIEAEDSPPQ